MIAPFKGRKIDPWKTVEVYRNLNSRTARWSIRQRGLVVGHCEEVSLRNVNFVVQRGGHRRFLRTGKRNVHAFARGMVTDLVIQRAKSRDIVYYLEGGLFQSVGSHNVHVTDAELVRFCRTGVYASGCGYTGVFPPSVVV